MKKLCQVTNTSQLCDRKTLPNYIAHRRAWESGNHTLASSIQESGTHKGVSASRTLAFWSAWNLRATEHWKQKGNCQIHHKTKLLHSLIYTDKTVSVAKQFFQKVILKIPTTYPTTLILVRSTEIVLQLLCNSTRAVVSVASFTMPI
jgi:hypothetical protein